MGITLEKDPDYEYVSCPTCGHKWHVHVGHGWEARVNKRTTFCPECNTPLIKPKAKSPYMSKEK